MLKNIDMHFMKKITLSSTLICLFISIWCDFNSLLIFPWSAREESARTWIEEQLKVAQILEDITEKGEPSAARSSAMGTDVSAQPDGQVHDNFGHNFWAGRHVSGQSALLRAIPWADDWPRSAVTN
jgi:hypothetical protein